MAKTEYVRARIDSGLKKQAEEILEAQGFTMSSAIIMMLRQVVIQNKLPFPIEGSLVPNARTMAVMDAIDSGEMPTMKFGSSAELFEHLGIGDKKS